MLSRRGALAALSGVTVPWVAAGSSSAPADAVEAPVPSGGDDLPALRAALPATGTLLLGPGIYRISGPLELGDGQDVLGAGGNIVGAATVLRATTPAAGLVIAGSAGTSGNLLVDGADLATAPFRRLLGGGGAQRTFLTLSVSNSARDNVLVAAAQNDTWLGCNAHAARRDNLVLEQGAGGHAFVRCEFNAAGRHQLRTEATVPGGPYPLPRDVTFDHCLFEREHPITGRGDTGAKLIAFDALTFTACAFYGSRASTGPRVDVAASGSVTFTGSRFGGESPALGGTGVRVADGARVVLAAQPRFQNLAVGVELTGGDPSVAVLGDVYWNGVVRRFGGAGSADTSVVAPFDAPVEIVRTAPGDRALSVSVAGERGVRAVLGADGSVGLGDGTAATPHAVLRAGGPGVLTMPAGQVVQSGRGPASARPPAAAAGPGATFYDTTRRTPIWSDGTVWRDAAGEPV